MLSSILLVTNEYPPEKTAGTAMSTRFMAEEMASRGYQVTVVVNTRRTAPAQESDGNLRVFRLRPLRLPMTRMAQRTALLFNIARRVRPDIIQGQSISCGALALLAGRGLHIPVATYVQGYDLYEAGIWARRTHVRWTLQYSHALAAVTSELRSKAFELSGRWGEVIPHGLRMRDSHALDRHAARSLLQLPQEARILLFVGRLIPEKGLMHLIRAMPRVLERRLDVRLVLVGDGTEKPMLAGLTRALNLERNVSFVGERAHEDVIQFMRASDVFVLPSLKEPFGIVLVEAMSCGLPIVASRTMGIPSIVDDGVNGFLVPPGDERALADRMGQLLSDPVQVAVIGQRNVEKAASYALPRVADRFLELWKNTLIQRERVSAADGRSTNAVAEVKKH